MENNNRGQNIFLSVVGIATLLVAIVGATFAYFSITVNGNDDASSIKITTAKLGSVEYDGTGDKIEAEDIYPGWEATKTFTISTSAETGADTEIEYEIWLNVDSDTTLDSPDFVYTLSGSTTGSGNVGSVVSETQVPNTSTKIGEGKLVGTSDEHSYTLTLTFKETDEDQNSLQGKIFNGTVRIVISSDTDKRTWDNELGSWVPWSEE